MKYCITAVRVAGAKRSLDDIVLIHDVVVTKTHRIRTNRDVKNTFRRIPDLFKRSVEEISKALAKGGNPES